MAEVLDYQSQHYLRRYIRKLSAPKQLQLKNLLSCGQAVNKAVGGVFLMADNQGNVKYHGHTHCKNPFCCPTCSAIVMEKYRAKIALAIEMLHKDYFGFMISLTIPHWKFMSCRETMEILRNTWNFFRQKSFKRSHGHVYHEFTQSVPIAHHVKVMEHTWGKENGWHPHFHGIMWTPRGNEYQVLDFEERLDDFWLRTAKRETLKYWKKNSLHQTVLLKGETYEQLVDRLYARSKDKVQGLKFSRDKKTGELLEVHSGAYLCGWGADNEVTGNIQRKASHNGHYTPYQILLESQSNPEMEELYIQFCLDVTKKPVFHRVDFSQTGLCSMIKEYRKTHPTESCIIQKKIQGSSDSKDWKVIAFFDSKDWYELSILDREDPVFANILYLAKHRREVLLEYIQQLLPDFSFQRNISCQRIEDEFNRVAS